MAALRLRLEAAGRKPDATTGRWRQVDDCALLFSGLELKPCPTP
jgi:hypothetical protein